MAYYQEAVSNSRAYVFKSCKQRYSYKYILKIKALPKDQHFDSWERLIRGVVIHAALEGLFLGESPAQFAKDAANEERQKPLTEQQHSALDVMESNASIIAAQLADWLPASEFTPYIHNGKPLIEFEVRAQMPGWPGGFLGYVDALLIHKPTNRPFLIDFKTRATFPAQGSEVYHTQMPYYMYALRAMGVVQVNTFVLLDIKAEPPKRKPRTLREDSGTFDGVRLSESGAFRWTPRFISDAEIQRTWEQFAKQSMSMSHFTSHDYAYMARDPFQCTSCEFRLICDGLLGGDDVRTILTENFKSPPPALKVLCG